MEDEYDENILYFLSTLPSKDVLNKNWIAKNAGGSKNEDNTGDG